MILYLNAKTKSKDVCLDCIHLVQSDGTEAILTWDESTIFRSDEGFSARYKGLYFNEEYANGELNSFFGCKVAEFVFESDEDTFLPVEVTSMTLVDGQDAKSCERKEYEILC